MEDLIRQLVQGLTDDVVDLQVQVAILQANVAWLTRYVWMLIAANVGSAIINGVLIKRNNRKK